MLVRFFSNFLFLILTFFCIHCGQDYNSNSFDEFGNLNCPSADAGFCEAWTILNESCIRCHKATHSDWNTYTSISDYVAAGLIDPNGSIDDSLIITKLKLYGPSGTMPESGYQLTEVQFETLKTWVETLP